MKHPGMPELDRLVRVIALLRGGFLDGGPGYRYCRLLSRYEDLADSEIKQLRASRRSQAAP